MYLTSHFFKASIDRDELSTWRQAKQCTEEGHVELWAVEEQERRVIVFHL